jgi:hypothetical protein
MTLADRLHLQALAQRRLEVPVPQDLGLVERRHLHLPPLVLQRTLWARSSRGWVLCSRVLWPSLPGYECVTHRIFMHPATTPRDFDIEESFMNNTLKATFDVSCTYFGF